MTDATTAHRGRPRSAEADRAIADATVALLAEQGWNHLTMNGVAQRAGVSTATLYRRFSCKEDLVCSAIVTRYEPRPPIDTGTLEGDLRAKLHEIVERMNSDGGRVTEGIIGEAVRNPRLGEILRGTVIAAGRDEMRQLFDRAVARGEIEGYDDIDLVASLIAGPLFHRLLITGEPVNRKVADRLLPMILRSLGYSPAPASASS